MFVSWLRNLIRRPSRAQRRISQPKKRKSLTTFRLSLEALEDRLVPAFVAPVANALDFTPTATAVGDFNGDAIPDVVAVRNITGRGVVGVMLGNGDGTFQASKISNTGNSNPIQVKVANVDGDGKQDVVTFGSYYIDSLTVLKGNGDGSFGAPTPYSYSIPPTEIEIGDMNNDGHPDLIAGNHFFNTTSVMLNNGLGVFGPKVDSTGVITPSDLATGDLNGDGKTDVVSTSQFGTGVNVQLGNGNGTLQAPKSFATGGSPVEATVADFNGDGKADIAVANNLNGIAVLMGNGDGTFKAASTYNLGTSALGINQGDFNGDGAIDLAERTGTGFAVELGNGDGTFQPPDLVAASPSTSLLAADFNHDDVTDIAEAGGGSINVSMNDSTPLSNATNGAVNFVLSAPASTVAGAAVPVTVTAVDASGNVIANYSGLVRLFTNDPQGTSVSYDFTAADGGTHTFSAGLNLYTAGTQSILVSAPLMGTASQEITVTPGNATRFAVTAPSTTVAGAPMTFSVIALDAYNNLGATYTGAVHFSSSDAQANLPADYTFTAADGGIHAFSATLKTVAAGGQTITASVGQFPPQVTPGTSAAITVTPTVGVSLSLTGGGGRIGSPHTVTVQARDIYGNATNLYNGTVHVTASDPAMVLPAADTAIVNGAGTFQVTPMTMGAQTLTATDINDPAITATESIVGTAGAATTFVVTPVPATTAGVSQSFTVTAYDAFGNVAADYTGTMAFSSSDAQAALPGLYTFTLADAGVHTFNVTLRTAGSQALTVRDLLNATLTTTQTGISVTAGAAASLTATPLHGTTAGVAQTFTVTARDAYGNLASGYRGTVNFSTSDTQAVLPSSYTFTAADAGTHTFSMTFKTSGGQTFAVTDAANATIISSQRDIPVTPAAMTGFAFRAPSNVVAGTPFTVVVYAVDAYGNTVTNYAGTVHFSGPSGGGNLLPADYAFTLADQGSHTFTITFTSTGTQTIGVQDVLKGSLKGQVSVKVNTSGTASGGGTGGGGGGGGGGGRGVA